MNDRELLRQFVEQSSRASFDELVERHIDLVYSVCLREVQDAALAEDATQVVFLLLATKAGTLSAETLIPGWLFNTARFVSRNALKQERRRLQYEQRAA